MKSDTPIIFWIHSPIGYESYLAFKKSYTAGPVFFATSRNIEMTGSIFNLGHPGLYQHQDSNQIDASCKAISDGIKSLMKAYTCYVLAIPQSAQPYIEALIESPFCHGFIYYDEGSACYEPHFLQKQSPIFHRYKMERNRAFEELAELLQISPENIYKRHLKGVPFFNLKHPKHSGCISFFKEAFPGENPHLLQIPEIDPQTENLCGNFAIALINDILNSSNEPKEIHRHLGNIIAIKSMLKEKVIFKPHPTDKESDIKSIIGEDAIMWSDFCKKNNIGFNSEVAFLGFQLYITSNNSTELYLTKLGKTNILSIN